MEKQKEEWKQLSVTHCPAPHCPGMLLESDACHEMKCSDCGKLWMYVGQWVNAKTWRKDVVQLIIPGKPIAKSRPFFSTKGGKFRAFTPKATASYENLVKTLAQKKFKKPLDGPLKLSISFLMPRPKYLIWKTKPMPRTYCDKRPDSSNLIKSIEDGLNGIAYHDDAQISILQVIREYHAGAEGPQTVIEIEKVSHGE